MRLVPLLAGLLAASIAVPAAHAQSEARVIVKLRADSATGRMQALSADDTAAARAATLGGRLGIAGLRAGRQIAPHTQVLMAPGIDARQLADRLSREADVERVTIDRRRFRAFVPDDPLYSAGPPVNLTAQTGGPVAGQWYLRPPSSSLRSAINAQAAWDRSFGNPDAVVAVLDTGVRFDHPDLRRVSAGGNLLAGRDFVDDVPTANDGDGWDADASDPGDWISAAHQSNNPDAFGPCDVSDSSWHGTQVAGLIAASTGNGIGMAGVAPQVRVLPVRVLGKCGGYDSDIVAAMRWAAGLDVPGVPRNQFPAWVINMSLGGSGSCTDDYEDAIAEINAVGTVVVVSAGNSAGQPVNSPANCRGAVGVGGLRHIGSKVGFSDMGPELALSAPGGNCVNIDPGTPCLYPILTTANSGRQQPVAGGAGATYTDAFNATFGTSFSAPLVAGAAALMLSVQPALTAAEVRAGLRASARPFPQSGATSLPGEPPVTRCPAPREGVEVFECYCTTSTCGAGMLDVAAATLGANVQARIAITSGTPTSGEPVTLSAAQSLLTAGRRIASTDWQLTDSNGIVASFVRNANGTVTATPSAGGSFVVRATVRDNTGVSSAASRTVLVEGPLPGSSGGGAFDPGWLLALLAAVAALTLSSGGNRGRARRP